MKISSLVISINDVASEITLESTAEKGKSLDDVIATLPDDDARYVLYEF